MRYLFLIVAVCMFGVMGCDSPGTEAPSVTHAETWLCLWEPDLTIAVIVRAEKKAYLEVRAGSEVGTVSLLNERLSVILNDGHWRRIDDTEPLLGPPPPGWNNMGLSDRIDMGVRINGTTSMPMFVHEPLPEHDAIDVTDLLPVSE